MIWSHVTDQQIPCFDQCQLTITWMSNIKGCYKLRLHASVNLLAGVWPPSCTTPPTSTTASHKYKHEHEHEHKKNEQFCFFFVLMLMSSALLVKTAHKTHKWVRSFFASASAYVYVVAVFTCAYAYACAYALVKTSL